MTKDQKYIELKYVEGKDYRYWDETNARVTYMSMDSLPSSEQEYCATRMRGEPVHVYCSDTRNMLKLTKLPHIVVTKMAVGPSGRILDCKAISTKPVRISPN